MKIEQTIIGSCLSYEKCMAQAVQKLRKKHFVFFAPVWREIMEFYKKGRDHEDMLFDVKKALDGEINDVAFQDFITLSQPSINDEIEQLIEDYNRRRLREISDTIYNVSPDEPYRDKTINAIHQLSDLLIGHETNEQTMDEVMDATVEMIEKIRAGEEIGFKTGLDIDKILHGFQPGQFYILAARPSMGKTALAVQMAKTISERVPVAFLSLETTNRSLGMRYIANHCRIPADKMQGGYINDEQMQTIRNGADDLSRLPIILDDTTDLSSEGIRAKVNHLVRKHDIKMLYVDYVQLMQSDKNSREQQVADISRSCVGVAKEFDIPVVGLAQLSRKNESRTDKRPMLSDLRESGQLEQDAFCVMFLHRPEYYGVDTMEDGTSSDGIAEIIIAKHKDGKTGIKRHYFEKENMRFENLTMNEPIHEPRSVKW